MIEIFRYSIGSIAWGLVIGIVCIALFFVLIKGWWKDARFVFASYVIGLVLGIILIYQSILVCGSVAIIKVANYSEPTLVEWYTNIQIIQKESCLQKSLTELSRILH